MADLLLIWAAAILSIAAVVGWLLHWYVADWREWPWVGPWWRADRRFGQTVTLDRFDSDSAQGGEYSGRLDQDSPPPLRTLAGTDDEWAAQLHAMNQLGKLGDLTRPVALLTHYEVEAVIRGLGVADWLPAAA